MFENQLYEVLSAFAGAKSEEDMTEAKRQARALGSLGALACCDAAREARARIRGAA